MKSKILILLVVVFTFGVADLSAQQTSRGYAVGDVANNEISDTVDFDRKAPILKEGDGKLYYIRNINLHGVKYLNHSILKSSAGLVEGDSIYLPSKFISNAMQRLWAPKYFSNIQIGATIEGDSLDLEVFLKERARILTWNIEGVSKSKAKDLQEEVLKLRRNTELSDYVIDKNVKLIKEHFAEKGFRTCDVDVRIANDTLYEQCLCGARGKVVARLFRRFLGLGLLCILVLVLNGVKGPCAAVVALRLVHYVEITRGLSVALGIFKLFFVQHNRFLSVALLDRNIAFTHKLLKLDKQSFGNLRRFALCRGKTFFRFEINQNARSSRLTGCKLKCILQS